MTMRKKTNTVKNKKIWRKVQKEKLKPFKPKNHKFCFRDNIINDPLDIFAKKWEPSILRKRDKISKGINNTKCRKIKKQFEILWN